ncbi:hypothetical protein SERLA73DRAFT_159695 [Serpula lacrymans var. lacrymans S7.3]|uniref:C2 NT-type domain-containing protein n=2 Tax=Serpula lacrymans var. lacrymans TaxID=341189 RepID=F8PRX5_SERL3|nr:uncharacterized protein SERLADRAFT_414721 [Serpula lacrymans var. lacrymans S7.9]EGO01210.1 hypothetical protein SERLA73DRAFT_159695 [Serpula lacrymans var. lacrymans S7.3]EGO26859.1 hypothetical protein SERLADRAFT_414721 [Serpula lacrymans var. lacrymans S7.9]
MFLSASIDQLNTQMHTALSNGRSSTSSSSTHDTNSTSGSSRTGTSLDTHSTSSTSFTSNSSFASGTLKSHNRPSNLTITAIGSPPPNSNSPPSESSRPASPSLRKPGFSPPNTHHNGNGNANHAPAHPSGLRAQIAHLLPRHALFHVRLTIHQLSSVPFVSGEFGVRWKFKGVSTPGRGGILGKVRGKGKIKARKGTKDVDGDKQGEANGKGKDKDSDTDGGGRDTASIIDTSLSEAHSIANSTPSRDSHFTIPSVVVSANSPISPPLHNPRAVSSASTASTSSSSCRSVNMTSTGPNTHPYAQYLSAEWLPQSYLDSQRDTLPTPSLAATTPPSSYVGAKGQTSFVHLKDHNIIWERTLDVVLQMGIGRETNELADCEAKLVVVQRVIPGDPDAPQNPRLGAVYLNLAQYVDAGSVTRRYLLRQSKTNATLKLTIQLEQVGGESSFTAPPLPKGEILGGVAGLLENDVYRTRPRMLDLYDRCSSDSSLSSASSASGASKRKKRKKPFDVARLPHTRGPRGTESMIDALFNPHPSTLRKVTPFTYFTEPQSWRDGANTVHPSKQGDDGDDDHGEEDEENYGRPGEGDSWNDTTRESSYADSLEGPGESESDYASMYTAPASASASVLSLRSMRSMRFPGGHHHRVEKEASSASGVEDKPRSWWRKIGMLRPGTPTGGAAPPFST